MVEEDESSSRMKVVVRIRPMNEREKNRDDKEIIQQLDEKALVFDPETQGDDEEYLRGFKKVAKLAEKQKRQYRRTRNATYCFDAVFGEDSTQEQVYQQTTADTVGTILNGYNCTVFAYGATGAGKTHTMLGTLDSPGVISRTVSSLFSQLMELREQNSDIKYSVSVNYLEVYNERVNDLMVDGKQGKDLPMREVGGEIRIARLTERDPKNPEELMSWLNDGNLRRTQHPTDANAQSSRSHAVFVVTLRQSQGTKTTRSKLTLVDLAGSERATATTNQGARLREGGNINKSLLALGNVINALADPKHKGHIKYRDSKLTRILKDGLGGTCRTIMIANVSPADEVYEDTLNTIKYADAAKSIRSNLKKRITEKQAHVGQYKAIIESQKAEILRLKAKLKAASESGPSSKPAAPVPVDPIWDTLITRQRESMALMSDEKSSVLEKYLKQNTFDIKDIIMEENESDDGPGTNRNIRVIAGIDAKTQRIREKREELEKQIKSTKPTTPPNAAVKWELAAAENREKAAIYERLMSKLFENSKETQKVLKEIAHNCDKPDVVRDLLCPQKFSVGFSDSPEQRDEGSVPSFLSITTKTFDDFIPIRTTSSLKPKTARGLSFDPKKPALRTRAAKTPQRTLSKSKSDPHMAVKYNFSNPNPRPKSAEKPKTKQKENISPPIATATVSSKRKSPQRMDEDFEVGSEPNGPKRIKTEMPSSAKTGPTPSYMRPTATSSRARDLATFKRLRVDKKAGNKSGDNMARLEALKQKLLRNQKKTDS